MNARIGSDEFFDERENANRKHRADAGGERPIWVGREFGKRLKSRYVLILANLLVMLVCTVVVFLRRSEWRRPLGLSCLMLTVMWFLVAAIN